MVSQLFYKFQDLRCSSFDPKFKHFFRVSWCRSFGFKEKVLLACVVHILQAVRKFSFFSDKAS